MLRLLMKFQNTTKSDIEDGIYYAYNLDSEYKVQGLKIYLEFLKCG